MAEDITIEGEGAKNGYINFPNCFRMNIGALNPSLLSIDVTGPTTPRCVMSTRRDGVCECRYTTDTEGIYRFVVTFDKVEVPGSPFEVKVEGELICDTSKVKVSGTALKVGKNRQVNEIVVDSRGSGITLPLQVYMEGTSKPEISFKTNPNGTTTVQYKPFTTGMYKLTMQYGEFDVPGSPFELRVKY